MITTTRSDGGAEVSSGCAGWVVVFKAGSKTAGSRASQSNE